MTISDSIKKFITAELVQDDIGEPIEDDTPLIDNGVIDSLGVMKLIAYLEETFAITVARDDLVPENFETPKLITALVTARMKDG